MQVGFRRRGAAVLEVLQDGGVSRETQQNLRNARLVLNADGTFKDLQKEHRSRSLKDYRKARFIDENKLELVKL